MNRCYTTLREDDQRPISQRDDLERLVYVMVYMYGLGLFWQDPATRACDERLSLKASLTEDQICYGFPPEVAEILRYARWELGPKERPDYNLLRTLLETAVSTV